MKRTTLLAAISLMFTVNAMAGEPVVPAHAQALNKGLVVAVTEPGAGAADTAWLLANQAADGYEVPVLLVLKPETRTDLLNNLKLSAADLPALIFLDSNGSERGRVVDTAPAIKVFEKTRESKVSMN